MALLLFQTVAVVDRLGKNLPSVSWMYSTQGTFLDSGATEQGRFQLGRRANQILGSFHQFQTAYLSILPSINILILHHSRGSVNHSPVQTFTWTEKLGRSSKESPIYAFVICESERLTGWSLSRKDAQTGISNKA